jgi:hypothetical protein|tara:strand:+ start:2477 stop:3259 length:783 start_codon:yes stop_codon:yes gene_type:complete
MSPSGYMAVMKILAKLAAKGGGKVPKGVKGMPPGRKSDWKIDFGAVKKGLARPKDFTTKGRRLRTGEVDVPYQKRKWASKPQWTERGPQFGQAKGAKRPKPSEFEEHLIQQMKAEFRGTPQGPPVSTPLSRVLAEQAKKGKTGPRSALKRLETSPEKLMAELAGGKLFEGKGGPIKLTEEDLEILEAHMKKPNYLDWDIEEDFKLNPWLTEHGPMGPGSASLNAALLSALGGGAGAAGLADALRNRSRGTAGGGPQPPSR